MPRKGTPFSPSCYHYFYIFLSSFLSSHHFHHSYSIIPIIRTPSFPSFVLHHSHHCATPSFPSFVLHYSHATHFPHSYLRTTLPILRRYHKHFLLQRGAPATLRHCSNNFESFASLPSH